MKCFLSRKRIVINIHTLYIFNVKSTWLWHTPCTYTRYTPFSMDFHDSDYRYLRYILWSAESNCFITLTDVLERFFTMDGSAEFSRDSEHDSSVDGATCFRTYSKLLHVILDHSFSHGNNIDSFLIRAKVEGFKQYQLYYYNSWSVWENDHHTT